MAEQYDVTSIAPTQIQDAGGRLKPGYLATITTKPHGMTGEVRLAQAHFTPELLAEHAAKLAAHLEAAANL